MKLTKSWSSYLVTPGDTANISYKGILRSLMLLLYEVMEWEGPLWRENPEIRLSDEIQKAELTLNYI